MRTTSEQKEKIRNLKTQIKSTQEELTEMLINLDVKKELELPKEEQETNKKTFTDSLAIKRATLTGLKGELKEARMNIHGSSFFQYIPHTGMNRRQARQFRKLRTQGKLKTT